MTRHRYIENLLEVGKSWEPKDFDTSTSKDNVFKMTWPPKEHFKNTAWGSEKALSVPHIRLAMETAGQNCLMYNLAKITFSHIK